MQEAFSLEAFAAERSNQNGRASSETGRVAAQTTILLNGGAATAILALFGRVPLPGFVVPVLCLSLYAVGVMVGAWMVHCQTEMLDRRSEFWQAHFLPEKKKDRDRFDKESKKWWSRMHAALGVSLACFAVATIGLAFVLWK